MNGCDIRLDARGDLWIVTVTCQGRSETYANSYAATRQGATKAAADGVWAAVNMVTGKPEVTARGVGAYAILAECHRQGYVCEVRKPHPNR